MSIFSSRERHLFDTHEPPYRVPAWAVGSVVEHDGHLYRVTKWEELPPVALDRGGSVGQWGVWGRRVSEHQIQRDVVSAAEAILGGEGPEED